MKKRKMAGKDKMKNEVWLYCTDGKIQIVRNYTENLERGRFPKSWRKDIIVPIYEKGDKDKTTIME